jgi:hypothetical protein
MALFRRRSTEKRLAKIGSIKRISLIFMAGDLEKRKQMQAESGAQRQKPFTGEKRVRKGNCVQRPYGSFENWRGY